MATDIEQIVLGELDRLDVAYEVIDIESELADTAAFCAHYGYAPEESGNCIVVASRSEPTTFVACLALAHTKLDVNKRVRKLMGVRKASFASPEQTRELTGMLIGGVTPFGLPADLPLYVDTRIRDLDRVIVGGGSRSTKVRVDPVAFDQLSQAEWIDDLAVAPLR